MNKTFSIPSKTFLLGEYVALEGGPVLVANTHPLFVFQSSYGREGSRLGIEQQSPAAKYVERHSDFFQNINWHFTDPHQGRGGLGASTAQYLAVYSLVNEEIDPEAMLMEYWQDAWGGKGLMPSGADLIAQWRAESLIYYDRKKQYLSELRWPFPEQDLVLVRTGSKVATHEHLLQLELGDVSDLAFLVERAETFLHEASITGFTSVINNYYQGLLARHWVAPQSVELLAKLKSSEGVWAAKGCGALGADVLLFIVDGSKLKGFRQKLSDMQLQIIATTANLNEKFLRGE